jgi:hypothetical protein
MRYFHAAVMFSSCFNMILRKCQVNIRLPVPGVLKIEVVKVAYHNPLLFPLQGVRGLNRCLIASYKIIPVATDTFKDSISPYIGILAK